ncbi:lipopolysaccharide biosynthesis protein [Thauera sp.]|jgi:PST family polysaccharide transporter|uniref:lipopolysaccharide biosynthesis protein n=1 Tax=Thauera sp. TaxID=1905334 RepID=UPI002A369A06|nr:lipopolysaccharide biosynthesis protein [Thauera sp.]MDX9885104.1 lipopolysaccharide biosynthesis protein [Thauera sp.]
MTAIGKSVATGALWMIALKVIERSIGVISTTILARLLIPADFGLVAMAMAIFAVLELTGQFGFDHAIIRKQDVTRSQLDTAWTLTICHGLLSGLALALLAAPAAQFFKEPRLEDIVHVLAAIAVVQSFENIGIMLFRKDLKFRKDFNFFLAKKLIAFACTVSLAFAFKSYWALVGGILASRTAGVILSYVVHPYRPRLSFSATRELLGFSKWVLLTGILGYFRTRGPDFILGRLAGAGSVGVFRVANELATLPTTELMFPIARAAYPGYAKVAHDRDALKQAYLAVQGSIIMLTLPAGVGIVMLADPFVKALLGFNWLEAIPLIQILGLYGALRVFQTTNNAIFNVLGKPYWNTSLMVLELLSVLPLLGWLIYSGHAIESAAWSYVVGSAIVVPCAVILISRVLRLSFRDRLRITWRPVLGAALMALALEWLIRTLGLPTSTLEAVWTLLIAVPLGALVFGITVLGVWYAVGKPNGTERKLLSLLLERLQPLRAR